MPRFPTRAAAMVALLVPFLAGCYHYRVEKPASDPGTVPRSRTFHSVAWGLVVKPEVMRAAECEQGTALDNVHVSTNAGYAILTTLTLGFWAPIRMEWQCTKPAAATGIIRPPDSPAPEEPRR
ncbi:MAG TPA: hypothetical protein VFQ38_06535 [Longimicrobiales bacterium]|nr:hypothetical protein [Longimicrobiales bacterium]